MDSQTPGDCKDADGNVVQHTFEALFAAFLTHGVKLPEMRVDWGPEQPRIHLGSVSLAEGHQLCRALGVEAL